VGRGRGKGEIKRWRERERRRKEKVVKSLTENGHLGMGGGGRSFDL
jgi:hypothetical protein